GSAQGAARGRAALGRPDQVFCPARHRLPRPGRSPRRPFWWRPEGAVTNAVLEAIRTRRVVRALTDAPIDRAQVEEVLKAARWAPSGGNRRLHRFVAVPGPGTPRARRVGCPRVCPRPPDPWSG